MDRLLHTGWVVAPVGYGVLWLSNYLWTNVPFLSSPTSSIPSVIASVGLFGSAWMLVTAIAFSLVKTYIFTGLFLVPAILVSKFLPKNLLENFLAKSPTANQIKLQSAHGVEIDAVEILHDNSDHWVVFSNANGVPFEQNLEFLQDYSKTVGVNIVTFNYRGVGESQGWPLKASDLAHDGDAAVRYLLHQKGVAENYIIFHGHSLGGGVSSILADRYKQTKLINDRSFRSLSSAAQQVMVHLNPLMSYFLCVLLGATLWLTAKFSPFKEYFPFWYCILGGLAIGYLVGKSGIVIAYAPKLMSLFGWEMEAVSMVDPERTICLYHRNDGMLPITKSDAFTVLQQAHGDNLQTFELYANEPNAHMYPLNAYPTEWSVLSQRLKQFIGVNNKSD